jgi:hypothetical protein
MPGSARRIIEDDLPKLLELAEAVADMRANITEPECPTCSCGSSTSVCNWYTVATCEYGERVDDALIAIGALKPYVATELPATARPGS